MTEPSDGCTTPPDLSLLLETGSTNRFHRGVPTDSNLYNSFFNRDHSVRRHFVNTVNTVARNGDIVPTQVVAFTFYSDLDGSMLPEFTNATGDYVPLLRNDGTYYTTGNNANAPTPEDIKPDISLDVINALAKTKNQEGMPTLHRWDGNPKTWYAWRSDAEGRFRRMSIVPPSISDSFKLSDNDDISLFDEISSHVKKEGGTANCRNLLCLIQDADKSGTALWQSMIEEFEKDNILISSTLRDKLKVTKLTQFPHKQHKGHYDVPDFFNFIKLSRRQLTEASGTWTEAENLEMLDNAFQGCTLNSAHYVLYKSLVRNSGMKITEESLEREMRGQSRDSLPKTILGSTSDGSQKCRACGKHGHAGPKSPDCDKHDPKYASKQKSEQKQTQHKQTFSAEQTSKEDWMQYHHDHKEIFTYLNTDLKEGETKVKLCWTCGAKDVLYTKCPNKKCQRITKETKAKLKALADPKSVSVAEADTSKKKKKVKIGVGYVTESDHFDLESTSKLIYDTTSIRVTDREKAKQRLLKLDSCSNLDVCPYHHRFTSMWIVANPTPVEGIHGGHKTAKYAGNTLDFLICDDGMVLPFERTNVTYDSEFNACPIITGFLTYTE